MKLTIEIKVPNDDSTDEVVAADIIREGMKKVLDPVPSEPFILRVGDFVEILRESWKRRRGMVCSPSSSRNRIQVIFTNGTQNFFTREELRRLEVK